MRRQLWPALKMVLLMTVLTGLLYPLAFTGLAHLAFHDQANGSLLEHRGHPVGSRLLGQAFTGHAYFHPRPSAAGHDPRSSSASNLGPTNPELLAEIEERVSRYRSVNDLAPTEPVPVDAVTTSASGLDPHISIANAVLQAQRVATARETSLEAVLQLIEERRHTGEAGYVNVLELNIALEEASR